MTTVLRRLSRSSAAMIWVRWPAWLTATHVEPGSRRSTSHWLPRSATIAASLPVSYPCCRSSRRAATVSAMRTTGGAGGGPPLRRVAVGGLADLPQAAELAKQGGQARGVVVADRGGAGVRHC